MGIEYKALIFWNTDWDKLAAVIGEHFQKQPPAETRIIEYTGNKDWPGSHNKGLNERYPYIEDIPGYIWNKFGKNEEKFYRYTIAPRLKTDITKYKPYYSIELHST